MKHPALILRHAAQVVAWPAVLGSTTVRAVACGRELLDGRHRDVLGRAREPSGLHRTVRAWQQA
eukprot:8934321-Lingulodinium_polyedra.AAC.1